MTKQFVTYEIALKLKELGFNEQCLAFYMPTFKELLPVYQEPIKRYFNCACSYETVHAPLWQQVIDWLREKHKYSVSIHVDEDNSTPSNIKYWYCIDSFFEVPNNKIVREGIEEVDNFNSYQEAREQAILKTIELIKK